MCEQCCKDLKNMGGLTKKAKGQSSWLAARVLKWEAIPVMRDMRVNMGVEAIIHHTRQRDTSKKKYKRIKVRANSGHYYK